MADFTEYVPNVQQYHAEADDAAVKGIVRHCGIALRSRDSSLVSGSDKSELDRVREGFLKKKLALTDSDAELDAAIKAVMVTMKGERAKSRVTVYYLLAKHYGKLDAFR